MLRATESNQTLIMSTGRNTGIIDDDDLTPGVKEIELNP